MFGRQRFEQTVQIKRPANGEPDGGNDCNDTGDQHCGNMEFDRPPMSRPRVDGIPNNDADKAQNESVTETPEEDRPCQEPVAFGIIRIDADDLGESGLETPRDPRLGFAVRIDAAVQHAFDIERLTAGD